MTASGIKEEKKERWLTVGFLREIPASLGGFALGVSLGWNSSAGEVLRNHLLDASALEIGLVGCVLNAGASFGVILLPFLVGRVDRTKAMFVTMPVLAVGWAFICLGGQKVWGDPWYKMVLCV